MSTDERIATGEAMGPDILIVDDDSSDVMLLANILKAEGLVVRPASNGPLALRSARAKPPALVLLDIRLPGMDGFEVCQKLKADPVTAAIPVLFISALHDDREKGKAFSVGGVDYITKPLQREEVLARIRTHLAIVQAHQSLVEQRNRAQQYLDIAGIMMIALGRDGRVVLINRKGCEILGAPEDEILGEDWFERFLPPGVRTATRGIFDQIVAGDLEQLEFHENPVRTKTGEERIIAWHNTTVRNTSGTITGTLASGEDVTEARIAEAALRQSEELYRTTIKSIGDAVISTDPDGRIVLMNAIAETLTGWDEAEARGRPLAEVFRIVHAETRLPCENPVGKVLRSRCIVGLANHTLLLSRDGAEYVLNDSGAPVLREDGELVGVVLVFRDVTREEKHRRDLERIDRIESLGVLAGGIAHDFNNILTAITGNLSMATDETCSPGETRILMKEAEIAAFRAQGLTQQLLSLSKGGIQNRAVDPCPAAVIEEAARFALRGSRSRLDLSVGPDLPAVLINANQIRQVIQNLVINADQAMAAGGTVRVSISRRSEADHGPGAAGDLVVSVEDHGVGIPADLLGRVFDPYVTTKQCGSGLGLAVVHSIIQHHDGAVTAESSPNHGTRFVVALPASTGAVEGTAEADALPDFAGSGTVLVMDDEHAIRSVLDRQLHHFHFEVVTAADGEAALEAFRRRRGRPDRFRLVITDLTIPGGMGGIELAREIRALDPRVPIVASSGYSEDLASASSASFGFTALLPKPYNRKMLNEVLWATLLPDSPPPLRS